jgi:hypothetical protein
VVPLTWTWRVAALALAVAALLLGVRAPAAHAAPCDPPIVNPVACENTKPGNPASEWDVSGSGSSSIQGFATDISVDQGQLIQFKVDTPSTNYRLDIYRMGYYGGMGARKVATVEPLAALPQIQPSCATNGSTGLIDCGNWGISASWSVPADAVSGIYFAKLVREDGTAGSSHIVFIVRDDDGRSDLLFQTSDTTWQAYNQYGGNSLYVGSPAGRAYKVSYNRPFTTRGTSPEDWVFNAEYPMVRFLERNGYNVSYFTGIDADRRGGEMTEHKAYLSVGHDEYWSGNQRANVEAARAAGAHLGFFSGNEVFWKTRLEPSIAGPVTANRTLVTYKETHANAKTDPQQNVWTGTWRDPRFSPPADGGRPENALTGQLFMVNDGATTSIRVPAVDGKMRFWRNTNVATQAAGSTVTLPNGTLGYEWDEDVDNGARPRGAFQLSSTTVNNAPVLTDYGSTFGSGTANHHMTIYRASSGALVFGAGTVQWPWGLDSNHDRGSAAADSRMQQATVNIFADMGLEPATLMSALTAATPSGDATAPMSTIASPANGGSVGAGATVTVSGTASDAGGGVVGGVEVSVDGGTTWHPASGRGTWTYSFRTGGSGSATIRSRAADDSGNVESPSAGVTVTIGSGNQTCPCSIWGASATPERAAETTDSAALEVGVKFRSQVAGRITKLRFYKGATNTGAHVGHLWTRTGTLLATATFTNETATGWQEVTLATPVATNANTTYVASYYAPNGNYAVNEDYFAGAGVDSPPLRALTDGEDGGNGVYGYGAPGTFPTGTFRSEQYWVDVVFDTGSAPPDNTPPTVTSTQPTNNATGVAPGANLTATFSEAIDPASITTSTVTLRDPSNNIVPAAVSYDAASRTATLNPNATLANNTNHSATISGGANGVKDSAGNTLANNHNWNFTTGAAPPPPVTAFPASTTILTGTARAGNAASLTADDNNFFQVTSTTTGTRTTAWYGSFPNVPTGATQLTLSYIGKNSRACTQTLAAWRWTDGTWQQVNSRSVGTTEISLADLAPSGAPSGYIGPGGEVRVRVRCTTTANFFASGELLKVTYSAP